ncbi:MAG: 30S ribosomal protein S8e [Candidatus Micrarchaeota archaeon]|nr:30S ribosomal protein S8e [Candidatus Micrarchaeota archaeon]MCX8154326.1 30S ribosomal protein S8e [Candidatus Micrarchaeota archaeon]
MYHEVRSGTVSRGTGAKKVPNRDKIKAHIGRDRILTKLSDHEERKIIRTKGGGIKVKLKRALYVNLALKDGKVIRTQIDKVIQSNTPNETRSNIITKGTIIETKGYGKAIITSRPNQHGVLNAKQI